MTAWFRPTAEYAPCPPFWVDNVYELFINQTERNNLTSEVVEEIRIKCSIEIPTTTTTTTKSTTTTTIKTTNTPGPTTQVTSETTKESTNATTTADILFNKTTSETVKTTTSRDQSTSNNSTDKATKSVSKITGITTELTSYSTTIISNVTVENVTIDTDSAPVYSSGCKGICIIGIVTGAVCLSLLLLLVIALATLFRRGKDTKSRSRSRSRSRFGDMPDVDLYDSIDIGESSKRNSTSSLFRRSGDFSRSPPVVFDNPAYRRSFELRPRKINSWYDPEATDYDYSQNNANLINRKLRIPDRRSLSTSRLYDKRVSEHKRHGSSSSWHPSIRDYVPKVIHRNSEGDCSSYSPYHPYSSQNGLLPNGTNTPPNRQALPRNPIENSRTDKASSAHTKHSYRSKSYDPDLSGGSSPWEEMDKKHSRSHYTKQNQSRKSTGRGKSDKMNRRRDRKSNDIEMNYDRIYRTGSEGKSNYLPRHPTKNSSNNDKHNRILSSNLQPVSFRHSGQTEDQRRSRSRSNSDRSADYYEYNPSQGSSFRDWGSDNYGRYSNRQSSYRPDDNEIYMFQTKL